MSQEKYIGMDVHQATISVAVMDARGKLIMECVLETKAATILEFIQGLRGTLAVSFEEGTSAAWLHDLLNPHVNRLVVCDPRKNALLKDGNKNESGGCAEAGRVVTHQPGQAGVPREAWNTRLKRVAAELFDHHQGCDPGDESNQSGVPKLGHSLCGHERLHSSPSRRVAGQAGGTRGSDSS